MKQQSKEWLEFRKSKIGASDAPIIMKESPWTTPYQLWLDKVFDISNNKRSAAMDRGINLEEEARNLFEKQTGIIVFPMVKLNPEIDWMMASLDGIDIEEKNIVEIKCPNKIDHAMAESGVVPKKYIPQLQHQLAVCHLDMAYYFSFNGLNGVFVKVYRDEKYIQDMLKKESEFYECMQNFTAPDLCEKDYQVKDDDFSNSIALKLLEIQEIIKKYEDEAKELKSNLISHCNNQNTIGNSFKLTRSLRKGSIDYSSIESIKNINLETYRKNPILTWRLSRA